MLKLKVLKRRPDVVLITNARIIEINRHLEFKVLKGKKIKNFSN